MEICWLPIEKLNPDPNRIFAPLPEPEYQALKENIRKYGIQEPLKVLKERDGIYTIKCGLNRYRVALELGLKSVPCDVRNAKTVRGVIYTEIRRRHLTPEERAEYEQKIEEYDRDSTRKYLGKNLIPGLFKLFNQGVISEDLAIELADRSNDEQGILVDSLSKEVYPEDEEVERLEKELKKTKEESLKLKETLLAKEANLKEMREREDKAKELLRKKLAELERAKENADKEVRKEYEKEIDELREKLKELSKVIKEKQDEVDRTKEEKESTERTLGGREAEVKAVRMEMNKHTEMCREFVMQCGRPDLLIRRIETIAAELDAISRYILSFWWDAETAGAVNAAVEVILKKARVIAKDVKERIGVQDGDTIFETARYKD